MIGELRGRHLESHSQCILQVVVLKNCFRKHSVYNIYRWKGKRPLTRGVAKNPVDHPHGGGEGKTAGGRNPVSPWGQSAKGLKTRRPQRSDKFIISRRKKRNEK